MSGALAMSRSCPTASATPGADEDSRTCKVTSAAAGAVPLPSSPARIIEMGRCASVVATASAAGPLKRTRSFEFLWPLLTIDALRERAGDLLLGSAGGQTAAEDGVERVDARSAVGGMRRWPKHEEPVGVRHRPEHRLALLVSHRGSR